LVHVTATRTGHAVALPVRRRARWLWLAAWAGVSAATFWSVRLTAPAALDPDEYASTYYFHRLVHGERLDQALLSTPKPLLTLVHGLAWELVGDWRVSVALTGMALAVMVVALARVASRLGVVPAAAAVALALLGSVPLVLETAHGNSVVWALAGWALAADALTVPRRRWALGGAALLLAALARSEGWLLLPPAAAWGVVAAARGERRALWLLPPLAVPLVWTAHDWLLTGNPLWSLHVPELYTKAVVGRNTRRLVVPPLEWLRIVRDRYLVDDPPLAAATLAGMVWLAWRRAWVLLAGMATLFFGVLVVFGVYSARGTFFTPRYFETPDTVMRFAAALGIAGACSAAALLLRRRPWPPPADGGPFAAARGGLGMAAAVAALALVAGLLWPLAPLDRPLAAELTAERRSSGNASMAVDALRPLAAEPETVLVVTRWQRTRIALELGLPVSRVLDLSRVGPLERGLRTATAVYHDAGADPVRCAPLARTSRGRLGALTLTPVLADPGRGVYVLLVQSPP
jgi:hypothetical protein